VVLRRQQRGDVALQHEVRLDASLDRLDHLGIGFVRDLAHFAADDPLPLRQRVDVGVHSWIGLVGHRSIRRT
jgi:hypothetical protein